MTIRKRLNSSPAGEKSTSFPYSTVSEVVINFTRILVDVKVATRQVMGKMGVVINVLVCDELPNTEEKRRLISGLYASYEDDIHIADRSPAESYDSYELKREKSCPFAFCKRGLSDETIVGNFIHRNYCSANK